MTPNDRLSRFIDEVLLDPRGNERRGENRTPAQLRADIARAQKARLNAHREPDGRPSTLSDAEWDARFAKFVDPDYYNRDVRSPLASTLRGTTFSLYSSGRAHTTSE
jgi:hypothetical protein